MVDFHIRPENAAAIGNLQPVQLGQKPLVERLGLGRLGGGQKIRPPAVGAIGVQGEIGYYHHPAAHVGQRQVEFAVFTFKNSEPGAFFRQIDGLFRPVAVGNAQQHNQPLVDFPPRLAVGCQRGAAGSDYHCAHEIPPIFLP